MSKDVLDHLIGFTGSNRNRKAGLIAVTLLGRVSRE
jgi:hypothetical protein